MNMTSNTSAPRRRGSLILVALVVALIALFVWMRREAAPGPADAPPPVAAAPVTAATVASTDSTLPPGAHWEQGILLAADGSRILNSAGLPPGPPLPVAKPIPVDAAPTEVVGYTVDAQGVSRPLRAGDIKTAANTPGSFAVVDMWANGGPAVVAPTQGTHLSPAQVEKMRAAERVRDQAQSNR